MIKGVGLVILFSAFIYTVLPTLLARLFRVGVIWRFPTGAGRVALTFDDGPDPNYTPQVLEILNRYGIKACFFLLGEKVRTYPELVREIIKSGHQIGCHGFKHQPACILTPRATRREIDRAMRILKDVTGVTPKFYRPPWGIFNLYSFWTAPKTNPVLWSFMSWDWGKASPERIVQRVLKRIKDGTILIFHDSDTAPGSTPQAPQKMLQALPVILEEIKRKNLKVVPLQEAVKLGFAKKITRSLWQQWEKLFHKLGRLHNVENSLFRLAQRSYRGPALVLSDGTELHKGDSILELHLNNNILSVITAQSRSETEIGIRLLNELRESLPTLARWLKKNPNFSGCKALIGITLLNRGTERLGFTTFEFPPGVFRMLTTAYQRWLLVLYHPGGQQRLKKHKTKLLPKKVIISVKDLIKRYS